MSIMFISEKRYVSFLNPFNNFLPIVREVEIRIDPLTGYISRILDLKLRYLDYDNYKESIRLSQKQICPFCVENFENMTARFFPQNILLSQLNLGEAAIFPNIFPYEAFNLILVPTNSHYLQPKNFTVDIVSNALMLSQQTFIKLAKDQSYASINWNYMMHAGASLVHPHFHLIASPHPTYFQSLLMSKVLEYSINKKKLINDYLKAEYLTKFRLIGETGGFIWLVPFAPKAIFDVMAIMPGNISLVELDFAELVNLSRGICRILAYFEDKGIDFFNLSIHTSLNFDRKLPFMLRLVSRLHMPPSGTDEINYFEKLHQETITYIYPEEIANEIRLFW